MNCKLSLLALLFSFTISAQITNQEVDDLVNRTMKTFNVPGIAVAIVKDGKVVLAKGYGVKSIVTHQKVDANTLFGIASNSKAFTTAALAILVDEGKIKWNDKVIQYLPDFKMYDDYVTREFTIRDLLTHRSGLGLGAGDLMIWPDGNDFKTQDVIHNLRYLKPTSGFRFKFDYNNLMYIAAGEIVHIVSGKTWADFVEERIMKPLEMNNSVTSLKRLKDTTNLITPHVLVDGKLKTIPRYENQLFEGAAGIYSNVNDLSKWAILQINNGKYGDNKQLFSEKEHDEMWQLQTIIPAKTTPPYNTHFSGYGLGWFLSDVKGYKQVSHTGGLEGNVTQTTLIPELGLGIIVLTNQQSGDAFNAITNTIKNSYLGIKSDVDYVTDYTNRMKTREESADKVTAEVWATVAKNKEKTDFSKIIGTYKDNWLGEINITERKGKIYFESKRSPQLAGEVFFYKDGNYVVKWNNAFSKADAHLLFKYDKSGKVVNLKMLPISELTDFSYDFQDLDFSKE